MLAVGVLVLGGAGEAVLRLAEARAQAVQPPTVLSVVNVVLEEELGRGSETLASAYQRPRLCTNPAHILMLSKVVVQVLQELHPSYSASIKVLVVQVVIALQNLLHPEDGTRSTSINSTAVPPSSWRWY